MNHFIFMAGSSAVGKTTLMNNAPETWIDPATGQGMDIQKVDMSFRKIRELLNNPTWDDLLTNQMTAEHQQDYGMGIYEERIQKLVEGANIESGNSIYLFERNPYDLAGYAFSFGLSMEFVTRLTERANVLMKLASKAGKVTSVFRPVDSKMKYAIEAARPPANIREACDSYLHSMADGVMPFTTHRTMVSVNHGDREIYDILNFAVSGLLPGHAADFAKKD